MFLQEATTYQHEVFLGELVLGQVGLHGGRLAQAGRARGHRTLDDLTLDGGYDFTNYQHQRLGPWA